MEVLYGVCRKGKYINNKSYVLKIDFVVERYVFVLLLINVLGNIVCIWKVVRRRI